MVISTTLIDSSYIQTKFQAVSNISKVLNHNSLSTEHIA
jgi:hypothetical protein